MDVQIAVFRRMRHLRLGAPQSIHFDREYDNKQFKAFCAETTTELHIVGENYQDTNGLVENVNRTLRSFFDRLRLCDKRSTT